MKRTHPLWRIYFVGIIGLFLLGILIGHLVIRQRYSITEKDGPDTSEYLSVFHTARTNVARILTGKKTELSKPVSTGSERVWIALYIPDSQNRGKAFFGAPYFLQIDGSGKTRAAAFHNAHARLLASKKLHAIHNLPEKERQDFLSRLRIKIDYLCGEGQVSDLHPLLRNLSFLYGIDGIRFQKNGRSVWVLPSEVVEAGISEVVRGQLRVGLNLTQLRHYAQRKSRMNLNGWSVSRFRTHSQIECGPKKNPKPVIRGNVLIPPASIDRPIIKSALLSAVSNLSQSIDTNGRFRYLYYPILNRQVGMGYSFPRHAGALWMIYRGQSVLSNQSQIEAANRGLEWFLDRTQMFTLPRGIYRVNLYNLAIGLLAVQEYRKVTGATNYDPLAKNMANAIVRLQDKRGLFQLRYSSRPKVVDPRKSPPYAPGEAMLALGRAFRTFRDPAYQKSMVKGMRFITSKIWSFFGSRLFYGFFAWEMQVIQENHRWLPGMESFVFDQADSYLNYQYMETWPENRDLLGAYHETVLRVPKAAHSGSRGEGVVAARRLAALLGNKGLEQKYRASLRNSVLFILNNQVRQENSWYYPNLKKALGGIRYMPSYHELRIDHTQHCAAVLQAAYEDRLFP